MQGEVAPDRTSPMEDGVDRLHAEARTQAGQAPGGSEDGAPDWLKLLKDAQQRGQQYFTENLQAPIDASYRAFRNKHFAGSKYWHTEYRNRSKLFRGKTRTAVRKAGAQAVAALFASNDAVKCTAGDETNPQQQANAALTQELFNYRTDRTSGMAAVPWFRICGGAHQDAMLQSACVSKQYWKLELRHMGAQDQKDEEAGEPVLDDETGEPLTQEVYKAFIDRPDCMLFPLENIIIDPAASWLSPIQSAAFFIAKHPMSVDEVMQMQKHPLNPWKTLDESTLRSYASTTEQTARDVRQQREGGTDRLDSRFTGTRSFEIVWVYEVFIRWRGQDITFWSAQDKAFLTDPKPVHEVYPEQGGERPYTFGVINLESHRLFPMSPSESWQQGQIEINDFANLILDTAKLGVAPITKVVKGAGVDLASLTRRGPNSQVLVTKAEDVTFEKSPEPTSSAFQIMAGLNVDFDDQAGQFNSGSVQTNRQLNETVGGLKLISGSANAIGEYDLRVWIETWVEPTIAQMIKCIQFYENDQTILALCGSKAQLFEKFGVSEINDHLLQQQVKIRVDAAIGNADPDQKLGRLANGLKVLEGVWANNPDVVSGAIKVNVKAISDEVFTICGYRDGADRFITVGQPQQNPNAGLEGDKLKSEIEKNKKQGNAALINSLAAAAKVDLGDRALEADNTNALLDRHLTATDHGHRHGMEIAQASHAQTMEKAGLARDLVGDAHSRADASHSQDMAERQFDASREDAAAQAAADGGGGASPSPSPPAQQDEAPEPQQPSQGANLIAQLVGLLQQARTRQFHFQRGPDGRITGATEVSGETPPPQPPPSPRMPPLPTSPAGPPPGGLIV